MTWLKQAIAAGYNNVELITKDSDLDALRDRADFQKLLLDLKTKLQKRADKDMSLEQAELNNQDIDARKDVYPLRLITCPAPAGARTASPPGTGDRR